MVTASEAVGGRFEVVGWHVVPGEPPGTLGWWNGREIVVVAFWAGDHWEYVTDDWAGSDPPPGLLPAGAGDPRSSGWWQTPEGQWHGPPTTPVSIPTGRSEQDPRDDGCLGSVALGVVLVGAAMVAVGFQGGNDLVVPGGFLMLVGGVMGVVAAARSRRTRRDRLLGATAAIGCVGFIILVIVSLMLLSQALIQMNHDL